MAIDLLFLSREIRIYYPYPQDFPKALLAQSGLSDAAIEASRSQPLVRVAKYQGNAIGVYLLSMESVEQFRLTAIAVHSDFQRRGLASWLVGHALGVAETKGARAIVCASHATVNGLLQRLGFTRHDSEWRLEILPE